MVVIESARVGAVEDTRKAHSPLDEWYGRGADRPAGLGGGQEK